MAHPVFRWSRLLPMVALLVFTTVAAAPVRHAWLPSTAQPLSPGIGTMPTVSAPALVASSATVRRDNAELEATLTSAPDRLLALRYASYTSTVSGHYGDPTAEAPAWTTSGRNRRGDAGVSVSGSSGGSLGFAGSGGLLDSRAAPSIGAPLSYSRSDDRMGAKGNSGSGKIAAGAGDSASASGGSVADAMFGDHRAGLADLTGRAVKDSIPWNGGSTQRGLGLKGRRLGPNLAANPEPATILLFGTGLAAVAGAVRRRLRSR